MNNKIYISETYLHYDLQKDLLNKNNNEPLLGVQFLDFHTYLETYSSYVINSLESTIEIYNHLQGIHDNLFSSLLDKLSFIHEIQSIHEELSLNNCSAKDIPINKKSQESLFELLSAIQDIPADGDFFKDVYLKLQAISDFSNVIFVNFSYKNTWEERIYQYMLEHGALSIHTQIPTQSVEYYFALNKRLECESVAQRIISLVNEGVNLSEIGIMVSNLADYKDVLSFVMNRYNIPIHIPNNTKLVPIRDFLLCFFNYYAKPNQVTLENLLSNTFLHVPHCESLFSYASALHFEYEDYFQEFNYCDKLKSSPFLSNGNDAILNTYEERSNQAKEYYVSFFDCFNTTSFVTLLDSLHEYLVNHNELLKDEDIKLINKYYEKFYDLSLTYKEQPIEFFCQLSIHWIESNEQRIERLSNQILVCDLHTPSMNLNYGFLLGMHQKSYPAFHNHSGLLNEELIEELPNFLPIATRYNNHMNMVAKNLRFAKHLIISFPQSNYEGKINEHSLELEMELNLKEPLLYPFKENNNTYKRTYELNPELAKQLFFSNNTINGSISRFEKFFNCPYQYYLNSGIRIKNLFSFKIQEAELGTLQHAFLETMVKNKGKQYTKASDTDIESFLDEQFTHYETVFKKDSRTINIIKHQIKNNLECVLENLHQIELHTSFRPKEVEYQYDMNLLTYKDITLHIKGIIDRIDEIEHGIRIIDYKSSDKTFSKKKFHSGQMLQLITYAYMASELLNKEVFGVYYFSMKPASSKHIAAKATRPRYSKKLERYDITSITESDVLNAREIKKLTGNTFVIDPDSLLHLDDTAGLYVHDIKGGNKEEREAGINAKVLKPFIYEEAKEQLLTIYQYLIDQLLAGTIDCTPTEDACTYCEYSSICMFKGEKKKHARAIILEDTTESEEE